VLTAAELEARAELVQELARWAIDRIPTRPQHDEIGACHRMQRAVLAAGDPRHHRAVVEAQDQLHLHLHLAPPTLDQPNEVRGPSAGRHAVGDDDHAGVGFEGGLQHLGLGQVAAVTLRLSPAGAIFQRPLQGSPSRAAKQAPESKLGQHSQSMEPSRPTRAAVSQSPIKA